MVTLDGVGVGVGGVVMVVNRVFVPPPHPNPHLFDKRRIGREEVLNGIPYFHRPVSTVSLEDHSDTETEAQHVSLSPLFLPYPQLFDNRLVGRDEGLNGSPCFFRPA